MLYRFSKSKLRENITNIFRRINGTLKDATRQYIFSFSSREKDGLKKQKTKKGQQTGTLI